MTVEDRPLSILLIEDDDIDVMSVRRSFAKRGHAWPVIVAHDGIEALKILRGEGEEPPLEQPYLVFLDLNMPRMNGFEFLEELRRDDRLRRSIVFVLTTSSAERDLAAAYDLNVAGFISKQGGGDIPDRIARLVEIYARIVHFPP